MRFPWDLERSNDDLAMSIYVIGADDAVHSCLNNIAVKHQLHAVFFAGIDGLEAAIGKDPRIQTDELTAKCFLMNVPSAEAHCLAPLEAMAARHRFCPSAVCVPHCSPKLVADVFKAGFSDVLFTPLSESVVDDQIRDIVVLSKTLCRAGRFHLETQRSLDSLSSREMMVLDRLTRRLSIKQIASDLGTSPHTVRNQRCSILGKLHVEDDAGLIYLMLSHLFVAHAERGRSLKTLAE